MRRFSLRRIPVPLRMGLAALVVLYAAGGRRAAAVKGRVTISCTGCED